MQDLLTSLNGVDDLPSILRMLARGPRFTLEESPDYFPEFRAYAAAFYPNEVAIPQTTTAHQVLACVCRSAVHPSNVIDQLNAKLRSCVVKEIESRTRLDDKFREWAIAFWNHEPASLMIRNARNAHELLESLAALPNVPGAYVDFTRAEIALFSHHARTSR
jgi:hypothetical protein